MSTVCYPPGTDWSCSGLSDEEIAALDPDRVAMAEGLAWMTLSALSGGQIAYCPITIRPCTASCAPPGTWLVAPVGAGALASLGTLRTAGFQPNMRNGVWYNSCGCGQGSGCGCGQMPVVELPGPVGGIVSVTIDGAELDPSAYRVDNGRLLVRQDGGVWPTHQNLANPSPTQYEPIVIEGNAGPITLTRNGQTVEVRAEVTDDGSTYAPAGTNPWPPSEYVQFDLVTLYDDGEIVMYGATGDIGKTVTGTYQTVAPSDGLDVTGVFEVTYYLGVAPNNVTLAAAGALAGEWYKACGGDACALPANAISVSRQGVSMELQAGIFPGGKTNIPIVDGLLEVYNPHGLRSAPVIASPDTLRPRMTTVRG
jgi:hypothetical protein